VCGFGLAAWLLFTRLGRGGNPASDLLLAYWALNLPVLGQELAHAAWQYPGHRNLMLRLVEPLGALEDEGSSWLRGDFPATTNDGTVRLKPDTTYSSSQQAVAIEFDNVSVRAAGHTILHDVS